MRLRKVIFIGFFCCVGLLGCQPIENYSAANTPVFTGSYAPATYPFDGRLKVITWNIKFAQEVDQAIQELQEAEALQGADVLLLQEMEETAVEQIAQELEYNYIYFPASVHSKHDSNFGNAILSKWPLSAPEKIILPHENPKNRQIRIAAKAITAIDGLEVALYSVHTETIWLSGAKRREQVAAIIAHLDDADFVFVGGDFNSATEASVAALDEKFAAVEMARISKGAGPTVEIGGVGFAADHIFARDGILLGNGFWPQTEASDHYPVWAEVSLQELAMNCAPECSD